MAIFIFIVVLIIVVLGLVSYLIFSLHEKKVFEVEQQKQIEVFKAANEAEEREKKKIAANLHDQIVARLSVIAANITKNIEEQDETGKINIGKQLISLNETIHDIRGISHDLVPGTLLQFGLLKALEYHIEDLEGGSKRVISFEDKTDYAELIPFSIPDQLNIYRMCLEILNNLYKYSEYKFLKVIVEATTSALQIIFLHNGNGITNEEIEVKSSASTGLGLKSLKSRAIILQATIDYFIEDELAHVILTIPFKR